MMPISEISSLESGWLFEIWNLKFAIVRRPPSQQAEEYSRRRRQDHDRAHRREARRREARPYDQSGKKENTKE
jgi:hypothetical protein